MSNDSKVNILSLFDKDFLATFKKNYKGHYNGTCPCCGQDPDNYGSFVIFPESNTCHCSSSKTNFDFTETAFLLSGEISCKEGRPSK